SASTRAVSGSNRSDDALPARSRATTVDCPSYTATDSQAVEVSSARICMTHFNGRALPRRAYNPRRLIMIELIIESLDQEGRGIAHAEGKVVFVEGALPGERVRAEIVKRKPSYDIARVGTVDVANANRVVPRCPHFGVCGGCTLQHADPLLQLAAKQRALEDAL